MNQLIDIASILKSFQPESIDNFHCSASCVVTLQSTQQHLCDSSLLELLACLARQCYRYYRIGLSSVLHPHQHSIGYMGDGFYRSKDPINSIKELKEIMRCINWRYLLTLYSY